MGTMNWTDRLSEYLDGELGDEDAERLESRLAAEPDLRALLEDLRAVKRAAADQPDLEAPADLWRGIRSRLAYADRSRVPMGGVGRRRLMLTLPQLAAAAGVVLLLGFGVGRMSDRARGPAGGDPAPSVAADLGAPRYAQFVADLESRLGAGRDVLDPGTVRVIEQSLARIDSAIVQARTALESDPDNTYLNQHLASTRSRKLRLLEDATTLIASRT